MMYGLSEKNIDKIRNVLASFPEVKEAIIYGSRARDDYKLASDIDLTLKGESINLSVLSAIDEKLDYLYLPYFIDLSAYHRLRNKDLIERIDKEGKVFYAQ